MKMIKYPEKEDWISLLQRPAADQNELFSLVRHVFSEIQAEGDLAVRKFSRKFDGADLPTIAVNQEAMEEAGREVGRGLREAIGLAKANIEKFHAAQNEKIRIIETTAGVKCWRESRAIERIGIYIPGGSAPLFSTVLMLGIPAKLARCEEIILCSPPGRDGRIHPAVLYAAGLVGITRVFAVGGIQAIGALAFGTESIPKVDKIFGPGNQYVTAAKQLAQLEGVAIDMPAGPSEVLVIADDSADPGYVAADLLSQAEHGADSQVVLLSDSQTIAERTIQEVNAQLSQLPRKETAGAALEHSRAIVLDSIADCIRFSNAYAPEHLILNVAGHEKYIDSIRSAGSVFLGPYSCESAGDYASGTNHTLPTNGYAKNYSGVSLDSFVKMITFQELSKEGLQSIGPAIEEMARAEQLMAHKNAVSIRLKDIE
jgi:histidinol dehydrogenase